MSRSAALRRRLYNTVNVCKRPASCAWRLRFRLHLEGPPSSIGVTGRLKLSLDLDVLGWGRRFRLPTEHRSGSTSISEFRAGETACPTNAAHSDPRKWLDLKGSALRRKSAATDNVARALLPAVSTLVSTPPSLAAQHDRRVHPCRTVCRRERRRRRYRQQHQRRDDVRHRIVRRNPEELRFQ